MQTIEQQAMERVQKARAELILSRRFYGVLVSNVEPVISRQFPTAATDGKKHYWNPEFVMSLTQPELLGVQAHESEHDARHHGTRRGHREPVEWNEAGDYSINIDLIAEGFTLPKGALIDKRYAGLSAEDIYRIRELDRKQEQQQPEEPKDEDGQDEGDDGKTDGDEADDEKGDEPGDEAGDEAEGDSDEAGDDGEPSTSDEAGDEAGDEPGQDAGDDAGEGEGEGEGKGSGEGGDATDEAGSGAGEPSFEGNFGEVLDAAAADEHDIAEQDAHWAKVVRQAVSMAKAAGQLPGHITREIERENNPPRDWRDELREFAEQGALRIETWNRPNRRFIGRGLILPGTQRDGVNKAVFGVDTSGSMDDVALACVRDEAQALLDDGVIDEVVVVYCDTRVTREDQYSTGDEIEFDPRGGGGTVLQPMFNHIAEQHDDASLIVCFTDGYTDINDNSPEPACPVLWAFTGYPDAVRRHIANAPWGAKGIDVGTH